VAKAGADPRRAIAERHAGGAALYRFCRLNSWIGTKRVNSLSSSAIVRPALTAWRRCTTILNRPDSRTRPRMIISCAGSE
jgi:hypothetical protein